MSDQVGEHRREAKRIRMLKGAVIAFSGRHATIPCVVRDISEGGARLQVEQGSGVPDTFELIVELDGLEVPCQVAWRKMREIGVTFLQRPKQASPKRAQVVGQSSPPARATLRRAPHAPAPDPTSTEQAATAAVPAAPVVAMPVARPPVAPAPSHGKAGHQGVIPILIADDDPDDRLLMKEAFQESNYNHPLAFVENGEELLKYVRGQAPYENRVYPGLILLDLNMPRMDGRTALMHLKTDSAFKRIPVIVLTTSNAEEDVQRTYDLGVTAYITKPGSFDGLVQLVRSLNDFWNRFVVPAAPAA